MVVLSMLMMFAVLMNFGDAKVNTCRHKFYTGNWSYCTKFGVAPSTKMKVQYKSRLLNYVKTSGLDD
jgi:hypothetical protein